MRVIISSRIENFGGQLVNSLEYLRDKLVNLREFPRVAYFIRLIEGKIKKAMDVAITFSPFLAHFLVWIIFFWLLNVLVNFLEGLGINSD